MAICHKAPHEHPQLLRCRSFCPQHLVHPSISTSAIAIEATLVQPSETDQEPSSDMRRFRSDSDLRDSTQPTLPPPNEARIASRPRSVDRALPLLRIPKSRPSIAIDFLPGIPPSPSPMPHPPSGPLTRICPGCGTFRPLTAEDQTTTVCQHCLTAFKREEKQVQRCGSILTSFPPLLTDSSKGSEHGDAADRGGRLDDGQTGQGGFRKLSIVESIGRAFGMLRGGGKTNSRRGSESSLESWFGSERSTPLSLESVSSRDSWSTS